MNQYGRSWIKLDGAISPATGYWRMSQQHRNHDVEAGSNRSGEDEESPSSVFEITRTKHASVERLRRWRVRMLSLSLLLLFLFHFWCWLFCLWWICCHAIYAMCVLHLVYFLIWAAAGFLASRLMFQLVVWVQNLTNLLFGIEEQTPQFTNFVISKVLWAIPASQWPLRSQYSDNWSYCNDVVLGLFSEGTCIYRPFLLNIKEQRIDSKRLMYTIIWIQFAGFGM